MSRGFYFMSDHVSYIIHTTTIVIIIALKYLLYVHTFDRLGKSKPQVLKKNLTQNTRSECEKDKVIIKKASLPRKSRSHYPIIYTLNFIFHFPLEICFHCQ